MSHNILDRQDNALSLIRIIAAAQVMIGHMITHYELSITDNLLIVAYFLRGVPIFYTMSGFLIWFSIGRSKSFGSYLKKRFWRIYPELWVAITIEIIVLITLYHDWTVKDIIPFIFAQGTVFQFWTPDSLRGYGVGTPNGVLGTVGVTIQFYLIAWFFYKLFKGRKLFFWFVGFVVSFFASWIIGFFLEHLGIELISKLYDQTVVRVFWLFYIGMFLAEFKDQIIQYLKKYWYVSLLIAILFCITKFDLHSKYYLFWSLFLVAGLIGFAYRFPRLQLRTDISYGIYLYHMTVVNVFVTFGLVKNWGYAFLSMGISLVLAWLSTKIIGTWSASQKVKRNTLTS